MLARKGILTKQEVLDTIKDRCRKKPQAVTMDQEPFPEPYLITECKAWSSRMSL